MNLRAGFCRALALLGVALFAQGASAATIFGGLTRNGSPLPRANVTLQCAGQPALTVPTDDRGSYRFTTTFNGSCQIGLDTAFAPVVLSAHPTQYDFELRQVDGRLRLVQR